MRKRDFIALDDYSSKDIETIIKLARQLKKDPGKNSDLLKGKSIALIFQKPSNRTRVSFETGIFQLGGNAIYLAPDDISLGKREPTADIARTLSRYVGGIVARVFDHQDLIELSRFSTVPVINALSDMLHPCQALADILTVKEKFGAFKGVKMAFIGDGNNMTNSLMITAAKVGMDMVVATPKGYEPDAVYVRKAQDCAKQTGATITLTHDPKAAARGADVLYTDTWVSMGQEEETKERLKDFKGYQIDKKLASLASKDYIFMHCLPAHRGQEVAADVIDGEHSVIFDEAENRLHVQKAVMVFLYT
ncbi:MAG: ornithine carbamoyltransferase [Candidatus Omnitrophota bacterium]